MEQKHWSHTGPWAIQSVAVLTACAGFVFARLVPESTVPLIIGVLLSCVIPQLVGGIILFRRGEVLLATICCLFGTVITMGAAFTLYEMVFMAPKPGALTPQLLGVFWFVLFIITEVFAIGFGRASWFLLLGIAEVGVAFLFLSINAWSGSETAGVIGGWLLIFFSAFCIYASSALLLGEHFERPILPMGKPIFK
jgi:succinate-acetate transporter protein